jgi:hypothetical protein
MFRDCPLNREMCPEITFLLAEKVSIVLLDKCVAGGEKHEA